MVRDTSSNRSTHSRTALSLSTDSPSAVPGDGTEPGTSASLAGGVPACCSTVALASSLRLPALPVLRSELILSVGPTPWRSPHPYSDELLAFPPLAPSAPVPVVCGLPGLFEPFGFAEPPPPP